MKINKKLLTFGILGLFAMALVTGALLSYYGKIYQSYDVEQAVELTCPTDDCIEELFAVMSPTLEPIYNEGYTLENNDMDNSRFVELVTSYSPYVYDEITTSYWTPVDYDETVDIIGYSIPAVVTVKDLGDSVEWTIDMDETAPAFSGGHAQYGLIISTDKVYPAFQVHANDGVDTNYPFGTHLYSEWVEGEGYNGWLTGTGGNNILVSDVGIFAVGERELTANTDAIFTITIPKTHLGYEKFYWAMQLMGQTSDTKYPNEWVKWSGDATTFANVELMEELPEQIGISSGDTIEFIIANEFDILNGDYTITTEVAPVTA